MRRISNKISWHRFFTGPLVMLLISTFASGQSFTRIVNQPPNLDLKSTRGASWGDYDNDGDADLFVSVDDTTNYLYRNDGGGSFTEMLAADVGSIVQDDGSSSSATWGDPDNDGDLDLFVANRFEVNFLYQNNGDGTFTRITSGQIATDLIDSRSSSWVDYDQDGFLDLFVANKGGVNYLYRGVGDGALTFSKITTGAIVNDFERSGTATWGDYDNDGDVDLFVANDDDGSAENNSLYRNENGLSFTKISAGAIVNDGGESESASWGDYDNDGDLDLFVANDGVNGDQDNFLYQNDGDGTFTKITASIVVNDAGDSEDCSWADYDNDGDLDLFVANNNGQNNFLYENTGGGVFSSVTGINIVTDGGESEGCAWADIDDDGDLDLFVSNDDMENFLYLNDGNGNSWLKIHLTGTVSNAAAIGARVRVRAALTGADNVWQMRDVRAQGNAKGQEPLTLHFGLAAASEVDSIIVDWPSGLRDTLINQSVNQRLDIAENSDPGTVPTAPTLLQATAVSSSQIDLQWQASSGNPQWYYIYRSTVSGGVNTLIDSVSSPGLIYFDTGLNPSTSYYYQVNAGNSFGISPLSNEASATTSGLAPGTPSGIIASAISSSQIDLSWIAATNAPEEYYIYRSTVSGTGFLLYDSLDAPATGYNDVGLPFSTSYYYRVSARNQWGESPQSAEVTAATFGISPAAPTNPAAVTISSSQIDLTWDASLNSPVEYFIYRSEVSGGVFVLIDSVDHPAVAFSDTNLNSSTTYYYKIIAANQWGISGFSGETSATTFGVAPATPGNFVAQTLDATTIQLSWSISPGEVTRYRIYRSGDGGSSFAIIDSVEHPGAVFVDSSLTPQSSYFYQISAVNQWGESPLSVQVSATTPGLAPGSPIGATAVASAADRIELAWFAGNPAPLRYRIYRSVTSTTGFTMIDSVVHPQTTFIDSALTAVTTYYYQLSAVNEWGESPLTAEISATTPPVGAPSTPVGVTATAAGYQEIDLVWQVSTGNPSRYRIFRSLTANTGFVVIDSVNHPVVNFRDNSPDSSQVYYYQVSAVNAIGESAVSLADSAITFGKPPQPQGVTATTLSADQIELNWSVAHPTAKSHYIYRASGPAAPFVLADSVEASLTSWVDSLRLPLTEYRYYLRAKNRFGLSAVSLTATTTTLGRPPTTPQNASAQALSATEVQLNWSVSENLPEVYRIFRSRQSGTGFALIDSTQHPDSVYIDTGLAPETDYFYYLIAANIWGQSVRTAEIVVRTPGTAPAVPSSPSAVALASDRIEVSWDSLTGGAEVYRIYRSLTTGVGFSLIDSVDRPLTVFIDSNLTSLTTYYYKIAAANQWGSSELSAEASATTPAPGVPGAPNLLNAEAAGFTLINLNWQPSQFGDPLRYRVFRALQKSGEYLQIDSVDAAITDYLDSGLDTTTTYFYQIRAVNAGGESPPSNIDSATTFGPPFTPVLLSANAASASKIDLLWQAAGGSPTRYRIYRGLALSSLVLIDSMDVPAVAYSDSGLLPQTTYVYRLTAVNQWGESQLSDTVQATTPDFGFPAAPGNLIAGTVSTQEILLRWDLSDSSAIYYRVFQAAMQNGNYVQIDSVLHPVNTYLDDALVPSTTYWYRVSAVNAIGESPLSNQAQSRTFGPPSIPEDLSAQAVSSQQIDLAWKSSIGSPVRYRIYRGQSSATVALIDSVDHPVTSFSDSGLTAGSQRFYYITSINQWGESLPSAIDSATTSGGLNAPQIVGAQLMVQPEVPGEGQSVAVSVPVSGEQLQVTLVYGRSDALEDQNRLPMQINGAVYQAVIPGISVTAAGVWFRIEVSNAAGTDVYPEVAAFDDINVRITGFAAIETSGAFPNGLPPDGWNTVALPFNAENAVFFSSLFGQQTFNSQGEPLNWAAYRYFDGDFTEVASLDPGEPAFVYHRSNSGIHLNPVGGVSNDLSALFTMQLQPGWNLLPWPYAFEEGLQITAADKIGSIWFQSNGNWTRMAGGGLADPKAIMPFAAIAIFNKTNSTLIAGDALRLAIPATTVKKSTGPGDWAINIGVGNHYRFDRDNMALVRADGHAGRDFLDEPEPLSAGSGLSLAFVADQRRLATDARSAAAEGHQWELQLSNPQRLKNLQFDWDLTAFPQDYRAVLIDIHANRTVVLAGEGSANEYAFSTVSNGRYLLIAGKAEFVAQQVDLALADLPGVFQLRQNYPNPFNGATTIAYDIARSGRVKIEIFNILGQRVRVVVSEFRETGRYQEIWDSLDDAGNPVASGIYIIRMQSADFQKTIRMAYVR